MQTFKSILASEAAMTLRCEQDAIDQLVAAYGTQAVLKSVTIAHEKTPGASRLPCDWRDIVRNIG